MRKPELPEMKTTLNYIAKVFAPEDEGLQNIRKRLEAHEREGINIGPVEGKILQLLMSLIQAQKVVEVGALFGYSAVWMARALPSEGHLYTIEKEAVAAAQARQSFAECGVAERVTLLEGDWAEQLPLLESHAPFDMIFIDANKSGYAKVLDWAQQNVRVGGLIIGDNTLLFGTVCADSKPEGVSQAQWSSMRSFNQQLANQEKFRSILIPTAEGLTVALKLK
jgi:predicted O-methyltransferase YrrM